MNTLLIVFIIFLVAQLALIVGFLWDMKQTITRLHQETLEQERQERIDLYNRIMSRDLADYSHHSQPTAQMKQRSSTNFLKEAQESALRLSVAESSFGGED